MLKQVETFKYLGSMISENGSCDVARKNRNENFEMDDGNKVD